MKFIVFISAAYTEHHYDEVDTAHETKRFTVEAETREQVIEATKDFTNKVYAGPNWDIEIEVASLDEIYAEETQFKIEKIITHILA